MPAIQSELQSRGRTKVRLPLDHHETEALAKRIHLLMCADMLNDDERGNLIKKYSELRKADFRLARSLFDRSLPVTSLRPMFFDDYRRPSSGAFSCNPVEVLAGWVFRLREYVENLERKYNIVSGEEGLSDDDDI